MPRPDAAERLKAVAPARGPSKALIAAVIAVVVLIAGVGTFLATRDTSDSSAPIPTAGVAGGNGIDLYPGVTLASGAKTVDVYEDFQCPICHEFEETNGAQMRTMAKAGDVEVVVHMMSFLDDSHPESDGSSKRAANASFCAADAGKFPQFHSTVYANQPATEGAGYTDDQLKSFGRTAGITGAAYSTFVKCVTDQKYKDYVTQTETRAGKNGVTGTPTFFIDGKQVPEGGDAYGTLLTSPNSFGSVVASFKG